MAVWMHGGFQGTEPLCLPCMFILVYTDWCLKQNYSKQYTFVPTAFYRLYSLSFLIVFFYDDFWLIMAPKQWAIKHTHTHTHYMFGRLYHLAWYIFILIWGECLMVHTSQNIPTDKLYWCIAIYRSWSQTNLRPSPIFWTTVNLCTDIHKTC